MTHSMARFVNDELDYAVPALCSCVVGTRFDSRLGQFSLRTYLKELHLAHYLAFVALS